MRLLLDTHVFLWFIQGDKQLSVALRAQIEDESNVKYVSLASLWEIAIKVSVGKLTFAPSFEERVPEQIAINGFETLDIQTNHLFEVARLPFHHRDPFDRLLIAQSLVETMPLLSVDAAFDAYGVQRIF